jgi:hypothetical protein
LRARHRRPIFPKGRPYLFALYSSMVTNADHPASWTDLAIRVRASPVTHRSSAYTAWLSQMIAVEVLWWKSRRLSATFAWARATLTRVFSLLLLPSACGSHQSSSSGWSGTEQILVLVVM